MKKDLKKLVKSNKTKAFLRVGFLVGIFMASITLIGISIGLNLIKGRYHAVAQIKSSSVISSLEDSSECFLCGKNGQNMIQYLWGCEDLGVICLNSGYVMEMHVQNYESSESLVMNYMGTGKDDCRLARTNYAGHDIAEISICLGG